MKAINIILDSVNFEQFRLADTPNIDSSKWHYTGPAQSCANATLPATTFFFQGRTAYVDGRLQIYGKVLNLVHTMKNRGCRTICMSSLAPLEYLFCRDDFDVFRVGEYVDACMEEYGEDWPVPLACGQRIIDESLAEIDGLDDYFLYIHIGDTHYPYDYVGRSSWHVPGYYHNLRNPDRELSMPVSFWDGLKEKQRRAITFLDSAISPLLTLDPDVLYVSSDHGEGWGENGLYFHGHGISDEIVSVPLMLRLKK